MIMNGSRIDYSGAYCVTPSPYESTFSSYNLRKMSSYMAEKKKKFLDLTEKEKESFRLKK